MTSLPTTNLDLFISGLLTAQDLRAIASKEDFLQLEEAVSNHLIQALGDIDQVTLYSLVQERALQKQALWTEQGISWDSPENPFQGIVYREWWEQLLTRSVSSYGIYRSSIAPLIVFSDLLGVSAELGLPDNSLKQKVRESVFDLFMPNGTLISIGMLRIASLMGKMKRLASDASVRLTDEDLDFHIRTILHLDDTLPLFESSTYKSNAFIGYNPFEGLSDSDLITGKELLISSILEGSTRLEFSKKPVGWKLFSKNDFKNLCKMFYITNIDHDLCYDGRSALRFLQKEIEKAPFSLSMVSACFGLDPEDLRRRIERGTIYSGSEPQTPQLNALSAVFSSCTKYISPFSKGMSIYLLSGRRDVFEKIKYGGYTKIEFADDSVNLVVTDRKEKKSLLRNHPNNLVASLPSEKKERILKPPTPRKAAALPAPALIPEPTEEELAQKKLLQQVCGILETACAQLPNIQPCDQDTALALLGNIYMVGDLVAQQIVRKSVPHHKEEVVRLTQLLDPLLVNRTKEFPDKLEENPWNQLLDLAKEFARFVDCSCLNNEMQNITQFLQQTLQQLSERAGALEVEAKILEEIRPDAHKIQKLVVDEDMLPLWMRTARKIADNVTDSGQQALLGGNPVANKTSEPTKALSDEYLKVALECRDRLDEMQRSIRLWATRLTQGNTLQVIIQQTEDQQPNGTLQSSDRRSLPASEPENIHHPKRIRENLECIWLTLAGKNITHAAFASFAQNYYGRNILPYSRVISMLALRDGEICPTLKNVSLAETIALLQIVRDIQHGDIYVPKHHDTTSMEIYYNPDLKHWQGRPGIEIKKLPSRRDGETRFLVSHHTKENLEFVIRQREGELPESASLVFQGGQKREMRHHLRTSLEGKPSQPQL